MVPIRIARSSSSPRTWSSRSSGPPMTRARAVNSSAGSSSRVASSTRAIWMDGLTTSRKAASAATSSSRSARLAGIAANESARSWRWRNSTSRAGCAVTWWPAPPSSRSQPSNDTDEPPAADRPEPDRRHRSGAPSDRLGVPTLRHGHVPTAIVLREMHVRRSAAPRARDAWNIVDLDHSVFCAQGAAVPRGRRCRVRALRRRVHRAARRSPRRGSADRERSGASGDRHADGADAGPGSRSAREADVCLPSVGGGRVSGGDDVAVVGLGIHEFGRHDGVSGLQMGAIAARRALASSGISWEDVDFAAGGSDAAGNADTSVSILGLTGVAFINVKNGCATGGSALTTAHAMLVSGAAEVALVVGFDKHPRGAFNPLPEDWGIGSWYGESGLMLTTQVFALKIQRYMAEHDITSSTLAKVAAKAFANGSRNPNAWRRRPLGEEEILSSKMVNNPLTQYMFCSPGEGAVAL